MGTFYFIYRSFLAWLGQLEGQLQGRDGQELEVDGPGRPLQQFRGESECMLQVGRRPKNDRYMKQKVPIYTTEKLS